MSAALQSWTLFAHLPGLVSIAVRQASTEPPVVETAALSLLQGGSRHNTLGALLIGSLTNYMFFALELVLIWRYFTLFPRCKDDAVWIRVLVLFMLVVDIATTADLSFLVYWQCVSSWGRAPSFTVESPIIIAYTVLTGVSAFCMQAFLINRYCLLSRNFVLSAFFVLCALTAIIGNALAAAISVGFVTSEERAMAEIYVCIWLGGSFATDVLVAMGLAWEFWRATPLQKTTKSLLRRLIRNSILCGALTACLAAAVLINFLVFPKHYNYATMVGSNLGRVCTITVVYNLNFRFTGRNMISRSGASDVDSYNLQSISLANLDQRSRTTQIVTDASGLRSTWSAPGRPGVLTHDDVRDEVLSTGQSQERISDLRSRVLSSS